MIQLIKFIIVVLSLFICDLSQGGTIDPNTPDSKYVEYGKKFECVMKICGEYNNGTKFCASCVVINKHWIVTAAHVVEDSNIVLVKDEKGNEYPIDRAYIHSEFDNEKFGLNDIALCYSEKPIELDFYPDLYSAQDEVDKICAISGYGITGNFNSGCKISDGKRRGGANRIDRIEKHLLICSPSKRNENFVQLEFMIGSGDSGGGLFIDKKLAGINSCVMAADKSPNSSYGDESGHTRISDHKEWIESTIRTYD